MTKYTGKILVTLYESSDQYVTKVMLFIVSQQNNIFDEKVSIGQWLDYDQNMTNVDQQFD